jgi:Fe-S oxidoreductase
MVPAAIRRLQKNLRRLRPWIRAGVPVVGLEPSCVSVLRDEMSSLLPRDQDAKRLAEQTFLFAEFLTRHGAHQRLGRIEGSTKAVVQGHCHQQALFGMQDEAELLKAVGVEAQVMDEGCCGLAGSFGFERGEKYRVSMQVGELGVLRHVRAADERALLVADGFSCREQIRAGAGRRALHVAEVARLAQASRLGAPAQIRPAKLDLRWALAAGVGVVAGAAAFTMLIGGRRARRRWW